MFDLTGKTALVTGATGGIGGAIARALHAQGAKVAVSGTRREVLDQLAAELGGAPVLPCDLANRDSVEALVPDAEKALGQLDILVANAGITKDNLFVAMNPGATQFAVTPRLAYSLPIDLNIPIMPALVAV